ncbi:hypothetical protein ACFLFF_28755 [Brevibacillus reuszeri]|uniref:hypothetical protein n=1 Tax=Brevibacillus reuszeri TaxID=54915 RepID=UPI0036707EDD
MSAEEFLQIVAPDKAAPSPFRMGMIPGTYMSGLPTVQFDGETVASTKRYPCFGSYTPRAGDRVLLARVGHGWVVMDKVRTL